MWKRIKIMILTTSILIFFAGSLLAQPPMDKEKIRERIETLRLWKMIEFLDLSPEQSDEFLPLFHKFQKARRESEMTRGELFKDLKDEVDSEEPDEKKITLILSKLEKNKEEIEREKESFLENSRKVLTPIQEAKFILFEHIFEMELKKTIKNLRPRHGFKRFEEG
jgi:Spy/CpxP family protein refolding chaperone